MQGQCAAYPQSDKILEQGKRRGHRPFPCYLLNASGLPFSMPSGRDTRGTAVPAFKECGSPGGPALLFHSSVLSQKFAKKFCHGPGGGSMDAAKIGGKTARSSAHAYIPRWNAGPSTEERVSSNLFSFQEKQRFTPPLAGRKHRLIPARTARLRPDPQKAFQLVKEFTTQDTRGDWR
jgi:hypothetical protein